MNHLNEFYAMSYMKSNKLYKSRQFEKSLIMKRKAFDLIPNAKLQVEINRLEETLNCGQTNISIAFRNIKNKVEIGNGYYLKRKHFNKLYNFQIEGIKWLFDLFFQRKGGILCDEMGLGKTIQVIVFINELFDSNLIKNVLILVPKTLMRNWQNEFRRWKKHLTVSIYDGAKKHLKLRNIINNGGILLATYKNVSKNWQKLNNNGNNKFNLLILDEGHRIKKDSNKSCIAANALRADNRIILTGSLFHNNHKELWCLFDFVHQGALLEDYSKFHSRYEVDILKSRKKNANEREINDGAQSANKLKKLINPFMLHRTIEEVTSCTMNTYTNHRLLNMPIKRELILWLSLSDNQIDVYKTITESTYMKNLILKTVSSLHEFKALQAICNHPRLLTIKQCEEMKLKRMRSYEEATIEDLKKESSKTKLLIDLINKLILENHKCVIFSQSSRVLNFIEFILHQSGISLVRIDGKISNMDIRQRKIEEFKDENINIMLSTFKICGEGLNLDSADRVIIFDISSNPSIDALAANRIYSIGQQRNVVTYRFVTCGTCEEIIYRRQIHKNELNLQTMGKENEFRDPVRYFDSKELSELFTYSNPNKSTIRGKINLKRVQKNYPEIYHHIEWLYNTNIFSISDHNRIFSATKLLKTSNKRILVESQRFTNNTRRGEDGAADLIMELYNDSNNKTDVEMKEEDMSIFKNPCNKINNEMILDRIDIENSGDVNVYGHGNSDDENKYGVIEVFDVIYDF